MTKSIVPADSRYIPLTQQKYCCVPTCIQMVMVRRGIQLQPAELIGHHLGLIVDTESAKYFWNVTTGERPSSGYGTPKSARIFALQCLKHCKCTQVFDQFN